MGEKTMTYQILQFIPSNTVPELVDDWAIDLSRPSTGSPGMNSIEDCWKRLNRRLGDRLLGSDDDLRLSIRCVLDDFNSSRKYG